MTTYHLPWVCIIISALGAPALAKECSAQSGNKSVALLELYTSEGCNSCPPADAWVSALASKGYTAERVVPLAFHVDYWDYIGWKDRFAQPGFTQRQRQASRRNALSSIYTPQLVLNGSAYRKWGDEFKLGRALDIINHTAPQASILLRSEAQGAELSLSAQVNLTAAPKSAASDLYLAVYENNLASDVKAGENRGVRLRHDHVVREWIGPIALNAGGATEVSKRVAWNPEWKRADVGVAAFVEDRASGAILQATSLAACF